MRNRFFIIDEIIIFDKFSKNIENKGIMIMNSYEVKVFDEF